MERPLCCPTCISRYENIHGLIYPVGATIGNRCEDLWHLGAEYDPNKLDLSADDLTFLHDMAIDAEQRTQK